MLLKVPKAWWFLGNEFAEHEIAAATEQLTFRRKENPRATMTAATLMDIMSTLMNYETERDLSGGETEGGAGSGHGASSEDEEGHSVKGGLLSFVGLHSWTSLTWYV